MTDLWGAPVSEIELARNEAGWLLVRGRSLPRPRAEANGLATQVFPLGAHGDALGSRDGSTMSTADGWLVEVVAGRTVAPGPRILALRLGTAETSIPVHVRSFALPDRLSFVPQMNAYGLPPNELDYYRLAHEHRTCLNVLRYSWRGVPSDGAAPIRRADGTWDWDAWDARFGPLLDGSAFAGARRDREPVDAFVYFKADRGSWAACTSPWVFDEPVNTQDFWALRRFGQEFLAGVGTRKNDIRVAFRCDISRPEWQRDLLDGLCGEEVVSGSLRTYRDRILRRQDRHGQRVLMYGAAADIGSPLIQAAAWCLDAWCLGADGIVPWQTIGTGASWTAPDSLSLFYPTSDTTAPVPSLRLKALTAGQQLVEYLTLLQHTGAHRREDVAHLVRQSVGLDGKLRKSSEADAGTIDYKSMSPGSLNTLRHRVAAVLDALPAPKLEAAAVAASAALDRRPPPFTPAAVPEAPVVHQAAPRIDPSR